MKIALVSLDQVWESKNANQLACIKYIKQAHLSKIDLIIFPEMTLTGFSMNTELISEFQNKSETYSFFSQLAKEYNISIVYGVVYKNDDKATNNLIVIDNEGQQLSTYAKIHPFSYSGENNFYIGGNELIISEIADAKIGLTICYDLRFPEIFQILSKECNIIITIANWPERRIMHWNALMQARAIENQVFLVGVNRTGVDGNNIKYVKSSAVFNPTGEKMKPTQSFLDMEIFDISLEDVLSVRSSFPVKKDRKIELYKSLL